MLKKVKLPPHISLLSSCTPIRCDTYSHVIFIVELKLQTPAEYKYLNQSGCVNVEGVDDADDFDQLRV